MVIGPAFTAGQFVVFQRAVLRKMLFLEAAAADVSRDQWNKGDVVTSP